MPVARPQILFLIPTISVLPLDGNATARLPETWKGLRMTSGDQGSTVSWPSMQRPSSLNSAWLAVFALLGCCCIPALPIYLWRKGRLPGRAVGAILAGWVALILVVGLVAPDDQSDNEAKPDADGQQSAVPRGATDPSATPTATPDPTESATPTPLPAAAKILALPKPKPRPKPKPLPKPDPEPVLVYYENCDAVRAAGAAPIYAGQPGYSRDLDRDGDGVGCET